MQRVPNPVLAVGDFQLLAALEVPGAKPAYHGQRLAVQKILVGRLLGGRLGMGGFYEAGKGGIKCLQPLKRGRAFYCCIYYVIIYAIYIIKGNYTRFPPFVQFALTEGKKMQLGIHKSSLWIPFFVSFNY